MVTDSGDDLCLFDGVDPEVGFELIVGLDFVGVIPGLLTQHIEQHLGDVTSVDARALSHGCRGGCLRGNRGGSRCDDRIHQGRGDAPSRGCVLRSGRVLGALGAPGVCQPERGERVEPGAQATLLGVVRVERDVLAILEDRAHERRLRALGTDLDEDARAIGPHLLDHGDELDRCGDLVRELLTNIGDILRIITAGDVGQDRRVRDLDVDGLEVAAQRLAGSGDDLGVEGVADRQHHDLHPLALEVFGHALHGLGEARDDGLVRRVLVGADDVSGLEALDLGLDLCGADRDTGHQTAVTVHRRRGRHLGAARGDRAERLFERHHAGGDACAVFAEAVTCDDIWLDAKLSEQAPERDVDREHSGLGDFGLAQRDERVGLIDLRQIGVDQITQVLAEHGRHHAVCFREGVADDRVALGQISEHPEVLRTLTGEQHRGLAARGELTRVEHALVREHAPALALLERLERSLEATGQFIRRLEHHREALLAFRQRGQRGVLDGKQPVGDSVQATGLDVSQRALDARLKRRGIRSAQREHALIPCGCAGLGCGGSLLHRSSVGGCRRGGRGGRRRPWVDEDGAASAAPLFHGDVEVRAAETERADARAARGALEDIPWLGAGLELERGLVDLEQRVWRGDVDGRGQRLVLHGERDLGHARGTCRRLEVSDHGLDRPEADLCRRWRRVILSEDARDRGDLDRISHRCRGTVRLDERDGVRPEACFLVGAAHGALLTDGVWRRDRLAATIARAADAANHTVDLITIALGIRQALEDERYGALAHHEAVGALVEGARAVGRERADLGEFDEASGAHDVVDAAGDHGVEAAREETSHSRLDGRERARAGSVHGEVAAAKVKQLRGATRDDVGELAGHRVLGDLEAPLHKGLLDLLEDVDLIRDREPLREHLAHGDLELGVLDAQVAEVAEITAHGVAKDHGAALAVKVSVEQPGVIERFPGGLEPERLAHVHLLDDHRGQPERLAIEGEVGDEAADLGVGLVGLAAILGVIKIRVPAILRDLDDGADALDDVVPERPARESAGEPRADADDGHLETARVLRKRARARGRRCLLGHGPSGVVLVRRGRERRLRGGVGFRSSVTRGDEVARALGDLGVKRGDAARLLEQRDALACVEEAIAFLLFPGEVLEDGAALGIDARDLLRLGRGTKPAKVVMLVGFLALLERDARRHPVALGGGDGVGGAVWQHARWRADRLSHDHGGLRGGANRLIHLGDGASRHGLARHQVGGAHLDAKLHALLDKWQKQRARCGSAHRITQPTRRQDRHLARDDLAAVDKPLQGRGAELPEREPADLADVSTSLGAFKEEATLTSLQGSVQHTGCWRVQVGPDAE